MDRLSVKSIANKTLNHAFKRPKLANTDAITMALTQKLSNKVFFTYNVSKQHDE